MKTHRGRPIKKIDLEKGLWDLVLVLYGVLAVSLLILSMLWKK